MLNQIVAVTVRILLFRAGPQDFPHAPVLALWLPAAAIAAYFVVFRTLPQKPRFLPSDYGLLKLLSTQAAAAIVHAYLFSQVGRRAPSVQAFIDQED